MANDTFWCSLGHMGVGLAVLAVGLIDMCVIGLMAGFGFMLWGSDRLDPADVPHPACLAQDAPFFEEFRREMANGLPRRYRMSHEPLLAWQESNVAEFFGMLAAGEHFTPGGHVYRDPAAFVARFSSERDVLDAKSCDFIGAVADARNWRPTTVEDAARRRIVHAAERIAYDVRVLEREMHHPPGDGRSESKSVVVRIESKGDLFASGRVTVTNAWEGQIIGEGDAARLDGALTRVRVFEPEPGSPLAAWKAFRVRAEADRPYRPATAGQPRHSARTTANAVPWTFLDDVWLMPAR